MRAERRLTTILKSTTAESRYEAFSWMAYNLFGSTVPIWLGGYFLLPIFSKHFSWIEYSKHGELALYSAAFLAPTLRLIGRDIEDSVFVRRQTFIFFGWVFLTAAVALYASVIAADQMPKEGLQVNYGLLFGFSLSLFIASVIFSSLVRLIDFQRIQPKEIFALQKSSQDSLEKEFDETGQGNADMGQTRTNNIAESTDQAGAPSQQPVPPDDVASNENVERPEDGHDGRTAEEDPN